MSLRNGSYLPQVTRKVVAWPKPDADGPGEPLWETKRDSQGRALGKEQVRDRNGNVVKQYPVPEGFKNIPTSAHQDSYTYFVDGEVYRTPSGEAVVIQPGQAIVFEPDGSVTVLSDEWEQHVFSLSHDRYDDSVTE